MAYKNRQRCIIALTRKEQRVASVETHGRASLQSNRGRTEQRLVLTRRAHCTDRSTTAPVVVVHVVVVRIEVEAPREERVVRVERARPVKTVQTNPEEPVVPT